MVSFFSISLILLTSFDVIFEAISSIFLNLIFLFFLVQVIVFYVNEESIEFLYTHDI